jgi:hypothetical protein
MPLAVLVRHCEICAHLAISSGHHYPLIFFIKVLAASGVLQVACLTLFKKPYPVQISSLPPPPCISSPKKIKIHNLFAVHFAF